MKSYINYKDANDNPTEMDDVLEGYKKLDIGLV